MCSCVVALSGLPQLQQYIQQPYKRRFYIVKHELFSKKEKQYRLASSASAPPALGGYSPASGSHSGSSWTSYKRHHCDVAIRMLLKKHESLFKLSQGM